MEKLITISEDSPTKTSIVPNDDGTIPFIQYSVLKKHPYKFNEIEFFKEVHYVKRKMFHLKIQNYSMKRMILLQKYGWGVHINHENKIAIIPCDSKKYQELLADSLIEKIKAYRINKIL